MSYSPVPGEHNPLPDFIDTIRRCLEVDSIYHRVVTELQSILQVDRVAIYRFNPDWSGQFVAEAVTPGWISLLDLQRLTPKLTHNISQCSLQSLGSPLGSSTSATMADPLALADPHWQLKAGELAAHAKLYRVRDTIDTPDLSPDYRQLLQRYQAQAYVIVAVYHGDRLWGLLGAYQNHGPHQWQADELQWLIQGGIQLGAAVQQAELIAHLKAQNQTLQENQSQLQEQLQWTQNQMIQGEKMASLGQLVAGIAHELNNPVNFVAGNLGYVEQYTQEVLELLDTYQQVYPRPLPAVQQLLDQVEMEFVQEDFPKAVRSMKVGTDRIRRLVQSLKNFSRMEESPQDAIDLHQGLDDTLLLLHHRLKSQTLVPPITITKHYSTLPPVQCYPAPLNQVFLNLITNGLDALEEWYQEGHHTQAPHLSITTTVCNGDWVSIMIKDNGPGIPSRIQSRIFDPFFTTKPSGKGTGLGLPISYQIVTDMHQGHLHCLSEPGKGTTFQVEIPIAIPPHPKS